ncbi:hypothetical protein PanWU01x14_290790 [Parasponia andersonii]|uniref:Uncharacterized protein n=1 Tax=Parasponia andersonii TaxID=3476 RepID=A0A2P5AXN3_PARAD|nr:hypothetical protein PanWU01x14_290790 [Parasponia andersonii]
MKPTPSISPCFDVKRSCNGPAKISLPARLSGHWSAIRPLFLTPLASGVSSCRHRPALSSCLSKFISSSVRMLDTSTTEILQGRDGRMKVHLYSY